MPSASYYREQARLLLDWAELYGASYPLTAARLEARAEDFFILATDFERLDKPTPDDLLHKALNAFNEQQMATKPAPVAQQQQQIQPQEDDDNTTPSGRI